MATNFMSQAKHKPCAIFAIFTQCESVLGVDDRSEFFVNISRDVAMATNFVAKLPTPCTYRCHTETEWDIATSLCVNDASISCENFVKFGPVVFELKWSRCLPSLWQHYLVAMATSLDKF